MPTKLELNTQIDSLKRELRALRMSILEAGAINMTPDEGLVERILSAYIDESLWSDHVPGLEPTDKLCIELNKITVERNEILRRALSEIKSMQVHSKKWTREWL